MLNWKHVIALFAALALPASAHAYEAWRGPTGLLKHTEEKSFDGYTVLAPLGSTKTFLIDNDANIINVWESEYRNGSSAIMLPNGHLLRGSTLPREEIAIPFGGFAGLIEEFDWEGNKVWELKVNSKKGVFHHGMQRLGIQDTGRSHCQRAQARDSGRDEHQRSQLAGGKAGGRLLARRHSRI